MKDFKTGFPLLKPVMQALLLSSLKNHELLLISSVLMRHFAAPFVQKIKEEKSGGISKHTF